MSDDELECMATMDADVFKVVQITGLGESIARHLLEAAGGSITAAVELHFETEGSGMSSAPDSAPVHVTPPDPEAGYQRWLAEEELEAASRRLNSHPVTSFPEDPDTLSYMMGVFGMKLLMHTARVCKGWRDAARAKLSEWSQLKYKQTVGIVGIAPGQYHSPRAVCAMPFKYMRDLPPEQQPDPEILVADTKNCRVQVLICPHGQSPRPLTPLTDLIPLPEDDPARADAPTLYEVVGKPSPTLRHVPKLCGPVAVLQAGDAVFIVDNHKVLKVRLCDSALLSRSAELWRCSGPTDDWHWNGGNPPPERPSMLSDTVLADGKLFVADATRDCVVVLDACSLAWQTNVRVAPPHQSRGSRRNAAAALAEPTGLCAHGFEIFVACKGSHCVQVLSHSGELVNQIGTKGSKPGEFNEPVGCALLPARGAAAARLIVAEKAGRRLQLLTLGGQPLQVVRLPAIGGAPPSLRGIALTEGREPTLWVTDVTAHALRRFSVHVPCS